MTNCFNNIRRAPCVLSDVVKQQTTPGIIKEQLPAAIAASFALVLRFISMFYFHGHSRPVARRISDPAAGH
jgi:hypothetical protein